MKKVYIPGNVIKTKSGKYSLLRQKGHSFYIVCRQSGEKWVQSGCYSAERLPSEEALLLNFLEKYENVRQES